ncbi:AfsR/SARP family transcriptional regulator [Exilibacterium tricleocarpae]|nr:BTAD domain-containing putative transcriptional regulator [Exilibacterium tricleocarpae]
MEVPRIYLLGNLELRRGQRRLPDPPSESAKWLLAAVLLAQGGFLHRYRLSAEFWPQLSAAAARSAFDREYWRLREYCRSIGLNPDDFFCSDSNLIGLGVKARHWLDVGQLRQALADTATVAAELAGDDLVAAAAAAVALYRGDLLQRCCDPWCVAQRQSLQMGLLHLLEFLMRAAMARGQWRTALARGRQVLARDARRSYIYAELAQCQAALDSRPTLVAGHAA